MHYSLNTVTRGLPAVIRCRHSGAGRNPGKREWVPMISLVERHNAGRFQSLPFKIKEWPTWRALSTL